MIVDLFWNRSQVLVLSYTRIDLDFFPNKADPLETMAVSQTKSNKVDTMPCEVVRKHTNHFTVAVLYENQVPRLIAL